MTISCHIAKWFFGYADWAWRAKSLVWDGPPHWKFPTLSSFSPSAALPAGILRKQSGQILFQGILPPPFKWNAFCHAFFHLEAIAWRAALATWPVAAKILRTPLAMPRAAVGLTGIIPETQDTFANLYCTSSCLLSFFSRHLKGQWFDLWVSWVRKKAVKNWLSIEQLAARFCFSTCIYISKHFNIPQHRSKDSRVFDPEAVSSSPPFSSRSTKCCASAVLAMWVPPQNSTDCDIHFSAPGSAKTSSMGEPASCKNHPNAKCLINRKYTYQTSG